MHFFTSEKDTSILRCFDHRASKSWLKVCVEHIAKARSIHIPRRGVAVRVLFLEVVVSPSSYAFDIKKPSLRSLERSQESSPWKSLDTIDVPVFACLFGLCSACHSFANKKKESFTLMRFCVLLFFWVPRIMHMWGTHFLRFPTMEAGSTRDSNLFPKGAPQHWFNSLIQLPTCHDEDLLLRTGSWWCEWGNLEVYQMWCPNVTGRKL